MEFKKKNKENFKKRAYLNAFTSVLDQLATQITGFFVSPFIVNGLGNTFYGIYHILLDLTSYAQMSDIRITQVLKWTIAQKRDVLSEKELQTEFTTALFLTFLILPIILLIGSVISWQSPKIANVEVEYYDLVRIVTSMMIFSLVIHKVMDVFQSLLRGMNIGFKGMGIRPIVIISSGILKVIVIKLDYGLIGLGMVQIFSAFSLLFVFYFLVKKNVPWFKITSTNKSKMFEYSKLSLWFMLSTFLNLALMNSDKIILGYLIGPELVTLYVLTTFSSNAMKGIINALISGAVPGMGSFFGQGQFEKLRMAKRLINSIIWLIGFSVGVSILLFNESFLRIWVGEGRFAGNLENMLIILIALQHIFFSSTSEFINVTLDLKQKVYLMALASITSISLSFMLVPSFQILGTVIALLVGRLILVFGYSSVLNKKMGFKSSVFSFSEIRPLFVTILFLSLAAFISPQLVVKSWVELIGYGLITALFLLILFWRVGLNKIERNLLAQKINFQGIKKMF